MAVTPNYGLAVYSITDTGTNFQTFRLAIADTNTTSNFQIIDYVLGDFETRIGDLENQGGIIQVSATASTTNVYTATVSEIVTYVAKQSIILYVNETNTNDSTLDINSLGARNLKKYNTSGTLVSLEAGDLTINNKYLFTDISGTWVLVSSDVPYGINAAKIANGTVSNEEFQYIGGLTSDAQTQLNGKEVATNKSTNVVTDGSSDTKYPSVKAIKDYADGLVVGLLDYRGAYDASGNAFPISGGSGSAGAILKGDMWIISIAGSLDGHAVQIGDSLIANEDTPGQTYSKWDILNANISYVPEDSANKENTTIDTSSTKYPTVGLLKSGLDGKEPVISKNTAFNKNFSTTATYVAMNGTQSVGVIDEVARIDHIHPTDSSRAADNAVVHLTGDETVGGVKTFTSFPLTASTAPSSNYEVANKKYVDDSVGASGELIIVTPDTNLTANGIKHTFEAGETLSVGNFCRLNGSDQMVKAKADSYAHANAIAICLESLSATSSGLFLLSGIFRNDSWTDASGTLIFLSATTAGEYVNASPSTTGKIVQILGTKKNDTNLLFNPCSVMMEIK